MTPEQLAALVADLRYGCNLQQRDGERAADAIEHLQAEVARLSTPPDDAEMAVLEGWLRNPWSKAAPGTERGPIPEWMYALMHQAADALTRLSHALAAERAKREAMEEALRYYANQFCEGFCDDMPSLEYTDENCEMDCGGCKARATLAKHGSK